MRSKQGRTLRLVFSEFRVSPPLNVTAREGFVSVP